MIRRPIPFWLFVVLGVGFVIGLGFLYAYLSHRQYGINEKQRVVPSYAAIGEGFAKAIKAQGTEENPKPSMLWTDLKATYGRLLMGLTVGTVLAIIIGILMGAYRWVEGALNPVITFMSKVPQIAILPIFFALVGTDEKMFTSMIAFGIFFTMAESIYLAARKDVHDDLINKAYTLGASDPEIIYEVIWKQILPRILDTIRTHIGPAMGFLLAAEMLVGSQGIGYRIRMEQRVNDMRIIFSYVAILGIVGLMSDWGLRWVRRKLCPWFGE